MISRAGGGGRGKIRRENKREREHFCTCRLPFARAHRSTCSPLDDLLPAGQPPPRRPTSSPTAHPSPPATPSPRMSISEAAAAPDNETEGANALKRNSDDVGWEYGVLVDAANKDKVKCKLCDKIMHGGIYQLKQHLAHQGKNVKKCQARTPQALEAKEKCKKALESAKRKREEKTVRELELREEVNVSRVGESEEVTCVGSSESHILGPMDKWTRVIDPKASKTESLKQQQLNKELWKERTHEVHKYIARWVYTHAIPFNACDNDEFKQMCEVIGQFGSGLEPPCQNSLRQKLLEE